MRKSDPSRTSANFDPVLKEQQLRSESDTWDTSRVEDAQPGDIPVIDLQAFFEILMKQHSRSLPGNCALPVRLSAFFRLSATRYRPR